MMGILRTTLRVYDPVGLIEKARELRKLEEQVDELLERIIELKESRRLRQRPKESQRKIKAQ
jgi:hypothetical protein